jgi:flagellar basal-body rod protein FlgF
MLYGLYLSATGVMNNSYRQDVISNNLANAQTVGFKRDLATFRERATAAQENPGLMDFTNPTMEGIGGGNLADPTTLDLSQGSMEQTGNNTDAAIDGSGYFTVDDHGTTKLTRNGQFMINQNGMLITANGTNLNVLDSAGNPIKLPEGTLSDDIDISQDGTVSADNKPIAKLGVFDVPDSSKLKNEGATLLSYPNTADLTASTSPIRSEFVENANVEPATELTALMETQRNLEANANMIHYQDSTLDKLVNTVGKVG